MAQDQNYMDVLKLPN